VRERDAKRLVNAVIICSYAAVRDRCGAAVAAAAAAVERETE
jgi:hypothetical protein